jgi:serine O-acetyltransferase
MFDNLRADLQAASTHRTLEKGWWRVWLRLETPVIVQYRLAHWVLNCRVPVVRQALLIFSLIWQRMIQIFMAGTLISPDAEIGPGLVLHTAFGLQIGPVKIGSNCTFNSGVVIGTGVKKIGDNVYFGSHAKLLADVSIGDNVVVVANSVVLVDVPPNVTIMGVPARIKLPGGRPKRFTWRTVEAKEKSKGTNGKPVEPAAAGGNGSSGSSELPAPPRAAASDEKART